MTGKGQQKKPYTSRQRSRPCPRCGEAFTPRHHSQKRCPTCADPARREYQREYERSKHRAKKAQKAESVAVATDSAIDHRVTAPHQYLYRRDFLLALHEMRRELRQQLGANTQPGVVPSDMEIRTRRSA